MRFKNKLVVMLVPLVLLSGCARQSKLPVKNKDSYHLTPKTADSSSMINSIRVSCKKGPYVKKSDCTLVQMTVDNKTDSVCSLNRSDLNVPLISQEEAEKLVKTSGFRKAVRILLPTVFGLGVVVSSLIGLVFVISSMPFPPFLPAAIGAAGLIAFGTTQVFLPDKENKYGIAYVCANNARKVIFPHETETMLLLVKGELKRDLGITLQSDNGPINYTLHLSD